MQGDHATGCLSASDMPIHRLGWFLQDQNDKSFAKGTRKDHSWMQELTVSGEQGTRLYVWLLLKRRALYHLLKSSVYTDSTLTAFSSFKSRE